ncbi:MAG: shikimate kinase [Gammaproteobacteria bacterium]|nr:shikimate kinase [Gammaproteobacteria bacterium]
MSNNIILIGLKACGKTSVAKNFAELYPSYKYIDTDDLIQENYSNNKASRYSIPEIYNNLGDVKFRDLESEVINNLSNDIKNDNIIIATGGGVILNNNIIITLKKLGKIIYLYCPPELIYKRWLDNNIKPSFVKNHKEFLQYISTRLNKYNSIADYKINTEGLNISEIINNILKI